MADKKILAKEIEELEHLLPRLKEYEKNFQITEEQEALQYAFYFYEKALWIHKSLARQEMKSYPELFMLFARLQHLNIHKYDQSTRTTGDSTWTLSTTWTLVIETPVGPFGVYTLGNVIVGEFKKILASLL